MISMDPGIWLEVIFIFIVYSFTIKETFLFKIVESTMIGVSAGIFTVVAVNNINNLAIIPLFKDNMYINIIPLLIGALMFTRVKKEYAYLSRIPIAIMLGGGIGVAMHRQISSMILAQIKGVLEPLPTSPMGWINIIVVLAGLIGTILIFTYTKKREGVFGKITTVGEIILMFAMGASYGIAITSRSTYVINRLQIIFYNLLGLG